MLKRKEDWKRCLEEEIDKRREYEFVYGKHDCCVLVIACVKAMTGVDALSDVGRYSGKEQANKMLEKHGGVEGVAMASAEKYGLECVEVGYAQAGDLVLHKTEDEFALGVMDIMPTHFVAATRPKGLLFIDKSEALKVWRV